MHPSEASRHPLRPVLVPPVRLDPSGLSGPTPEQARNRKRWRRTSCGHYVPATVDGDRPEQRILEKCVLLRRGGAVTGWAALRWWGAPWFDGRRGEQRQLPVPMATGWYGDLHRQPGLAVSREWLEPREISLVDGLPVTTAERAALFEARYAGSLEAAVVALDMAAASGLVDVAGLRAAVVGLGGWTGVRLARRALDLADDNSWSSEETRLRLLCVLEAGLPPLLANAAVFDRDGRHVATPDLLEPESGLALDYDGEYHSDGARRARDGVRSEALGDVGIEHRTVVGPDLRSRAHLVERVRRAYDRARSRRTDQQTWTTTTPHGWLARPSPLRVVSPPSTVVPLSVDVLAG